uniref:Uncharacterized protein n=1 Tax=Vespula pensylvanica TaxID=30213 RepID=A0A834NH33_VESPE|nr:hypothetical protein H0235_013919 [Vespula pensylvanica]
MDTWPFYCTPLSFSEFPSNTSRHVTLKYTYLSTYVALSSNKKLDDTGKLNCLGKFYSISRVHLWEAGRQVKEEEEWELLDR